ncbi:MAG TPA: hypothetical protein VH475_07295 [Tepidisphaeraceae bacterium]|jgi:hypothetical protein
MTRLSIDIPDDIRARLEARASRSGHASVEEFIQSLLREEAAEALDEDLGAPAHLSFRSDEELEQILVRRIDDDQGTIEATPEFWVDLRRRAQERRQKGN